MEKISEVLATYNASNLEDRMQFELDGVVEKEVKQAYCAENLEFCVSCMDYTTLKVTDTEDSVKSFVADLFEETEKREFAGSGCRVCVSELCGHCEGRIEGYGHPDGCCCGRLSLIPDVYGTETFRV